MNFSHCCAENLNDFVLLCMLAGLGGGRGVAGWGGEKANGVGVGVLPVPWRMGH